MKASELRQSILLAAVQGKLVPQNLHDEPAWELLKRIRAEKARLIKKGKIKKEKPLPPIAEDEIPFDLPEGWVWCRLSDIGEIIGGATPSSSESAYYTKPGNGIAWITPADMKNAVNGIICHGSKDVTDAGFHSCSTRLLPKGSVIFSSRAPIGSLALAGNTLCTNQGFKSIVPYNMNMRKWIYYYLKHITISIISRASGTTFKEVSGEFMKHEVIPLPPLAEQQHIVAKVNELMALCDELEAAEKELETRDNHFIEYLPKSILRTAVEGKLVSQDSRDEPASKLLKRIHAEKARLIKKGELKKEKPLPPISEDEIPYDLPEGWGWCRLSEIGEIIGGATPSSSEPTYYTKPGDGIAWITPADIKNTISGVIRRGNKDITEAGFHSCSTRLLPKGSILFSSRAPIGSLALAGNALCTNQGFKSIVPYNMNMQKWIYYYLMYITISIIGRASGTTFKEVSGEFMKHEVIPIPPLAEQQRIVAKVNELMVLCDKLKQAKDLPVTPADIKPSVVSPSKQPKKQPDVIGIAARGDVSQGFSSKLQNVIDNLFEDDDDE